MQKNTYRYALGPGASAQTGAVVRVAGAGGGGGGVEEGRQHVLEGAQPQAAGPRARPDAVLLLPVGCGE